MSGRSREPSPIAAAELELLLELKTRSDAGEVDPSMFLEAKKRLLESPPPDRSGAPYPKAPAPDEELSLLQELREVGALTEEEYELLQRRLLLWI